MGKEGPVRRAATLWRRSIQARVVISTLLLCAVVVTLVGWLLMRQITSGLVDSKVQSSIAEASRGTLLPRSVRPETIASRCGRV